MGNKLKKLEKRLKDKDNFYFCLYTKIKSWAISELETGRDIPEQIRHDHTHSKKLMDFACIILGDRSADEFPDERELFLLLSSFYLHDIGICFGWKKHLGINGNRGNLKLEERLLIRKSMP